MKRLLFALVIAAVVTAVVVPDVVALVTTGHAPRCSYAPNIGSFCVTWNNSLGRYNASPAGAGADFTAAPADESETMVLAIYAAAVFVATAVTTWLVLLLAAAIRRRGSKAPPTPAPAAGGS